jgi:hypothetical protein
MNVHILIYMGLAAAYCDAAVESLLEGRWHSACREAVITFLYASIAGLMVFDPAFFPIEPTLIA